MDHERKELLAQKKAQLKAKQQRAEILSLIHIFRPLYKDFMYWPRDLHLLRVPVKIPPQYTLCLLYTSRCV